MPFSLFWMIECFKRIKSTIIKFLCSKLFRSWIRISSRQILSVHYSESIQVFISLYFEISAAMISAPIVLASFLHNRKIYSLDRNQFGVKFFFLFQKRCRWSFVWFTLSWNHSDRRNPFICRRITIEIFLINRLILTIPYPFTAGYQRYDEKDLI